MQNFKEKELCVFVFYCSSFNISCSLFCSVFYFFHEGKEHQFPFSLGFILLLRSPVLWWGTCMNPQGMLVLVTFLILSLELSFLNPVKLDFLKFCHKFFKFLALTLALFQNPDLLFHTGLCPGVSFHLCNKAFAFGPDPENRDTCITSLTCLGLWGWVLGVCRFKSCYQDVLTVTSDAQTPRESKLPSSSHPQLCWFYWAQGSCVYSLNLNRSRREMTFYRKVRWGKSASAHFGGVTSAYIRACHCRRNSWVCLMVLFCFQSLGQPKTLQRCLFSSALCTHASTKLGIFLSQNRSWVAWGDSNTVFILERR